MSYPEDSPAAIASLSVIREILMVLRDKGILTSNEIVDAINKTDPESPPKANLIRWCTKPACG